MSLASPLVLLLSRAVTEDTSTSVHFKSVPASSFLSVLLRPRSDTAESDGKGMACGLEGRARAPRRSTADSAQLHTRQSSTEHSLACSSKQAPPTPQSKSPPHGLPISTPALQASLVSHSLQTRSKPDGHSHS
eukprot:697616-Rhodomonas_salina.3